MTTENYTLDDFTTESEEGDETIITDRTEDNTVDTRDQNDDEMYDGESAGLCPYHEADLNDCEEILDTDLIEYFNFRDIGCGHAINYISEEVGVTLSKNTAKCYSSFFRLFVEFLHERETTVCQAEMNDVKQYFNRLVRLKRSESTIYSHRAAITNLYKHIEIYREIDTNVRWSTIRELINPSEYNTPERRERKPLEKDEVRKLYDAADNFRNRLMIQTGVELGPRNGDLSSIRIQDVDLDSKQICLSNTKSGGSYELPISNQLSLLLRHWINQERPAHPGAEGSDYLFPSKLGGKLCTGSFTEIVKKIAEDAGIQETQKSETPITQRQKEFMDTDKEYVEYARVTPHTLRHTFNYLLEQANIPRDARSAALDHKSEKVTEEFYEHNETNYTEILKELFSSKGSLLDD